MKKKSMGRPTLPEGKAKSVTVQARLSEADHVLVERAADAQGIKISQWVRERILVAAKRELRQK